METKIFTWLGREFVEISGEAQVGASVESATAALFEKFADSLSRVGLSLDNTARIRVYGRDRQARTDATLARSKVLSGHRRAASSSFISQQWFDSPGSGGLELLALRPVNAMAQRKPVDFEPARNYLCYLDYDGLLFFSGFTSEAATLTQQIKDVLGTLDNAFARAKTDWSKVKKLSLLLQRGSNVEDVRQVLAAANRLSVPEIEFTFVDGFAGEKYLVEIEATAILS
ncbi:MAG TPA: Rid family hydrolase [Candidatus Binatia bacterium]|nr:Rid family hydrolase [Candidatus Binatia bacterium]